MRMSSIFVQRVACAHTQRQECAAAFDPKKYHHRILPEWSQAELTAHRILYPSGLKLVFIVGNNLKCSQL